MAASALRADSTLSPTLHIMNICDYIWLISQGWGGGLSVCKDDPSSAHTSSFVLTRPVPTTQWNHVTCTKHLHSRYVNYKQNIRNLDIHMESNSTHKIFTLKICKLYTKQKLHKTYETLIYTIESCRLHKIFTLKIYAHCSIQKTCETVEHARILADHSLVCRSLSYWDYQL